MTPYEFPGPRGKAYTHIQRAVWESPAMNALTPHEHVIVIEFIMKWGRHTQSGKRPDRVQEGVPFSFEDVRHLRVGRSKFFATMPKLEGVFVIKAGKGGGRSKTRYRATDNWKQWKPEEPGQESTKTTHSTMPKSPQKGRLRVQEMDGSRFHNVPDSGGILREEDPDTDREGEIRTLAIKISELFEPDLSAEYQLEFPILQKAIAAYGDLHEVWELAKQVSANNRAGDAGAAYERLYRKLAAGGG